MQWLTRLLMVKEAERSLFLFYIAVFVFIGVGLSIGRGSVTALFLKRYGVQYLPVMYAALSVFMTAASLTYAAYVDRITSERLFVRMLAVLSVLITFLWGGMSFTSAEWVYPAYYLLFELASELLIIHAKLYMEQNFDGLQLQRLASPMFASVSIGKVLGGLLLGVLAPLINVANTLLVWAALGAIPALLIIRHHRHAGISPYYRPARKGRGGLKRSFEQVAQGLRFFRKTELLRNASFGFFFMVTGFFILEYSVGRVLTETFPEERQLASFIGWISAFTGTTALVLQLFVTSKLLRRFGATKMGLVMPSSMAISFLALLVSFTLPAALVAIFTRDVVMNAIRKPARMALLHALPDYMMGRINALSIGLVLPVALLTASGLLLLTQALPVPSYFVVGGIFASLLYLYFRLRANRAFAPTLLATLSHRLFLPHRHGEDLTDADNEDLIKELVRGVAGTDENMAYAYARMLAAVRPEEAVRAIAERLPMASYRTRDRLLRLLIAHKLPAADILNDALADTDVRLKATILEALFDAKDARAVAHVAPCLASDNPRLAALGVLGVYRYALSALDASAQQTWERLLTSAHEGGNIAGLELLARIHDRRLLSRLRALLEHRSARVQRKALDSLSHFPPGTLAEFGDTLKALYRADDPAIRASCIAAFRVLDPETRQELCLRAIEDEHHAVRDAALSLLEECEGRAQAVDIVTQRIVENRGTPRSQQSALNALARHRPASEVFERIAALKVKEAGSLFRALEIIRREYGKQSRPDAVELLKVILQERVTQALDLALMAMENFEDRAAIAAIRAGLASGDRRHIAHACEALHNLHNHALSAPLIAVIDPAGVDEGKQRDTHGEAPETARDVIAWCVAHPDAWLRECAARVASLPVSVEA